MVCITRSFLKHQPGEPTMKLHFFELEYRLLWEGKKKTSTGKCSCLCLNKCESLMASEAVKAEAVREHVTVVPHCFRRFSEWVQAKHMHFSNLGYINPRHIIVRCVFLVWVGVHSITGSSYFDFKAPVHIRQSIDDCWNKLQKYSLKEAPPPPFLAPSHLDFSMASVWLTAGLGLGTADGNKQFKQQPGKENYCLLGLLYLTLTPGLIWPEFTTWSLVPDTDPALPQLLDPVVSVCDQFPGPSLSSCHLTVAAVLLIYILDR